MSSEKTGSEIYSLHRYLDEHGAPDRERIFSEGDSKFWIKRHIDPWLLAHLKNQPEIIREDKYVDNHIRSCTECREKIKLDKHEEQQDLPLSPE